MTEIGAAAAAAAANQSFKRIQFQIDFASKNCDFEN